MGPPSSTFNRPKRNVGPWTSSRILNSSSPIASKDLHQFLITCISGWDKNYSEEEKRSIIETLPLAYQQFNLDARGKLQCPMTIEFVLEEPFIKAAVSRFKNDVTDGYYQVQWQKQALRAMREREEGKFDEYLRDYAQNMFGGTRDEGTGNNGTLGDDDNDDDNDNDNDNDKTNNRGKSSRNGAVDDANAYEDFDAGNDLHSSRRGRK